MMVSSSKNGTLISSAASGAALIAHDQSSVVRYQREDSKLACDDFLVRRVLPRLSILNGNYAYHGAAIGNGKTGVMLLGQSGTGKTAMATAISRVSGWSMLAEDTTLLDAGFNILPGATGSGLWEDACKGLNLPASQCREMSHYEGKFWFEPVQLADAAPQPLKVIVLLSRCNDGHSDTLRFECVPKAQAFAAVSSHFVRLYPGDGLEQMRLQYAASQVTAIPVWHVSYPNGFERLSEIGSAICDLASQ